VGAVWRRWAPVRRGGVVVAAVAAVVVLLVRLHGVATGQVEAVLAVQKHLLLVTLETRDEEREEEEGVILVEDPGTPPLIPTNDSHPLWTLYYTLY